MMLMNKDKLRLKELAPTEAERLLPCLEALDAYHNDVSVHFSGQRLGAVLYVMAAYLCKICTKSRAVCKRHPESSQKVCKNGQERLQYTSTYFCF